MFVVQILNCPYLFKEQTEGRNKQYFNLTDLSALTILFVYLYFYPTKKTKIAIIKDGTVDIIDW